ncbi:MAG: response regulator transcription factor, partial [Opitutaceae bacterium]
CITDIHMPRMDGLAFIDAARDLDPGLGFVVLSAFDTAENLKRAIPLAVYDFLPKPLGTRADLEERIPGWIERTRERRREQDLARAAGTIADDRDAARLERDVEIVFSETAREVLRQTAGLQTTVHAHLISAITQLVARSRSDPGLAQIVRGLEEARKTAEASMSATGGFFDSSYGSRDASPAQPNEGIRQAIDIALRSSRAESEGKRVDFQPTERATIVRGLSGIDFLLMVIPAIGATLACASPGTPVGVTLEFAPRLDAVTRDPRHRRLLWINRKRALSSHPVLVITLSADGPSLTPTEVEDWLKGEHAPLTAVTPRGLLSGIEKCRGAFGAAVAPEAAKFQLLLALPA